MTVYRPSIVGIVWFLTESPGYSPRLYHYCHTTIGTKKLLEKLEEHMHMLQRHKEMSNERSLSLQFIKANIVLSDCESLN